MKTCKDCIKYDACRNFKTCDIPCEDCQLIREHCYKSDDYAKYCEYYINKDEYQKVAHAKWEELPARFVDDEIFIGIRCSHCLTVNRYEFAQPYCSNCGAKMDLE